ncbi:MAG: DEAD/DEAH box helicase family protein [Planctomycetaceae bacterium]|nr:DEAD/DEAH box helicase family protein [Planctomycetaceae bacterium]
MTDFSERDICSKFVSPATLSRGWEQGSVREEVRLTDGHIIVRGKVARRILGPKSLNGPRRADYVLYAYPRVALAVVEAKRDIFSLGHGMQQALVNAEMRDAPFAISSNDTGFLLHDRTGLTTPTERELALDQFPTYDELLAIDKQWKGIQTSAQETILTQPYYSDGTDKQPHYYQEVAINRTLNEIAKGQQRLMLVMATGTGKTYTAFQIIWRLWKAKQESKRTTCWRNAHILP